MQTHTDKFQAIAVGKKIHDENISFNLDGNIIKCDVEVKLLGVTMVLVTFLTIGHSHYSGHYIYES
jgi:hypothetical protein